MKKITCFVAFLIAVFGFSSLAAAQSQQNKTVELILHKRITQDQDAATTYVNDGTGDFDQEWLNKSQPLDQVKFQVFDASEAYLAARKSGQTPADFAKDYYQRVDQEPNRGAMLEDAVKHYGEAIQEVETATSEVSGEKQSGIAHISGLSEYEDTELGSYGAYLIIETEASREIGVDLDQYARPILVLLPFTGTTGQAMSQIHLYPKNVAYARDPYFFKFAKQTDGQELPLAGAKFVLYRLDDKGEKKYLAKEKMNQQNQWLQSADPAKDTGIASFSSDAKGLVLLTNYTLSTGTYYFEEIATVKGYEIDAAAKAVKVEVPDRWQDDEGKEQKILLNGEGLSNVTGGKLPDTVMAAQTPRIYNHQKDEPSDPSKPTKPSDGSHGTSQFPSTGEAKAAFSILGFMIVVMTLYYWKKRKEA